MPPGHQGTSVQEVKEVLINTQDGKVHVKSRKTARSEWFPVFPDVVTPPDYVLLIIKTSNGSISRLKNKSQIRRKHTPPTHYASGDRAVRPEEQRLVMQHALLEFEGEIKTTNKSWV